MRTPWHTAGRARLIVLQRKQSAVSSTDSPQHVQLTQRSKLVVPCNKFPALDGGIVGLRPTRMRACPLLRQLRPEVWGSRCATVHHLGFQLYACALVYA